MAEQSKLLAKATQLKKMAEDFAERKKQADSVRALTTRKGQVREICGLAAKQAKIIAVLVEAGDFVVPKFPKVTELRSKLRSISKNMEKDPGSIVGAKELGEAKLSDGLRAVELGLLTAWKEYLLGRKVDGGLEAVLARFKDYKEIAKGITKIKEDLRELSLQLPEKKIFLQKAHRLKTSLAEELQKLEAGGLDEEVVAFLRVVPSGVTLKELKPAVLEWIKRKNLQDHFIVKLP
jgi:hypothetical protein